MSDEQLSEDEVALKRAEILAESQASGGGDLTDAPQVDYFGFDETFVVDLPDNKSWIAHKTLNEGAKRQFMNKANHGVTLHRSTGEANLKMAPGDDRANLLRLAITDWNLTRNGQAYPFNKSNLDKVLNEFPPHILDIVERDIRTKNKWLSAEVTVEDIDEELENLSKLREEKVKEAEGNVGSSS